jgi:uncharacterized protein (DUF1697 family)
VAGDASSVLPPLACSRPDASSGPTIQGSVAGASIRSAVARGQCRRGEARADGRVSLDTAGLGYSRVATLLNSGNAVFHATSGTPGRYAASIAAALAGHLKLDVPVIVKSARELATIVAESPIKAEPPNHSRLLVAFVQQPKALAGLASIERLVAPPEKFAIGSQAAYLFCATGILESKAGNALFGKAGQQATTRNWATVLKLQALAAAHDGIRHAQ